jgi:hypothetical protein
MWNIAKIFCLIFFISFLNACSSVEPIVIKTNSTQAIIIDHTSTDIRKIPKKWIDKAKKEFGIAYGHTSHGSQIISGMTALKYKSKIFDFSDHQNANELTLYDREPRGDLGNPDRERWAKRTYTLLKEGYGDVNVVIWSWCGQVSSANEEDINTYLHLMNELEMLFPGVAFVYMTGHLDGTGENGNLNIRNTQIREYCKNNNKILFDFADIESFDPDGNYYLNQNANDNCDYRENGIKRNWADEWCNKNPGDCIEYRCAHSKSLNCDLKGNAFWWMMARIAGWVPEN